MLKVDQKNMEEIPQTSKKVIIVENAETHDFLSNQFMDWDAQHPVFSLDQLWDDLENGSLSVDSEIVFITDELYALDKDFFIVTLGTLAPHALLLVTAWNPENIKTIEERVFIYCVESQLPHGVIHWIEPSLAISKIEEAMISYNARNVLLINQDTQEEATSKSLDVKKENENTVSNEPIND